MEPILNSNTHSLTFKHISNSATEIYQYIEGRRKGTIRSLRTKWKKFNDLCMGGLEPNAIYIIASISGGGKSAFISSIETDIFDLNIGEDIVVLNLSFEMQSSKIVGRKLSYKLKKTASELYSVTSKLDQKDLTDIETELKTIRDYPIFYVDTPGTVEEIGNTITKFREMYVKDKWLIITIDHALLTKQSTGERERETLVNLQRLLIQEKKIGKTTIIELSQLNREIEEKDRITNPSLHFPQRRDIAGSDSLYHGADYVIVMHRPEILGLKVYGISNWPVKDMIYLHFLKNRSGELKILSFINNLKYNSIEEYLPTVTISPDQITI